MLSEVPGMAGGSTPFYRAWRLVIYALQEAFMNQLTKLVVWCLVVLFSHTAGAQDGLESLRQP